MGLNLYCLERDCVGVQRAWLREVAAWRLRDEVRGCSAGRLRAREWAAGRLLALAARLDPSVGAAIPARPGRAR